MCSSNADQVLQSQSKAENAGAEDAGFTQAEAQHACTRGSQIKEDDISFLIDLAEKAGDLALSMRSSIEIMEKSGPKDPVTTADIELSGMLVSAIKNRFPNDVIVSEEDKERSQISGRGRVWMIDPIDGTRGYIQNDGQYAVMLGLLVDGRPEFGSVNVPAERKTFFGGPGHGSWSSTSSERRRLAPLPRLNFADQARVIMGSRDRKSHPWVEELPQVELVRSGSIGVKVARILERRADLYVHLSGHLKSWDTAGPVAIALGNGLDVGTIEGDDLTFDFVKLFHESSVIIGRSGAIDWCRHYLECRHYLDNPEHECGARRDGEAQ